MSAFLTAKSCRAPKNGARYEHNRVIAVMHLADDKAWSTNKSFIMVDRVTDNSELDRMACTPEIDLGRNTAVSVVMEGSMVKRDVDGR